MPIARFRDLCLDGPQHDSDGLSTFWAGVLGATASKSHRGYLVEVPPTLLWVNPVAEPRIGKTRVHLDLRLPEPDVSPLVALGARIVTEPDVDPWWILADPDGNLFCAFPPNAESVPVSGVPAAPFELVVDCGDPDAQAAWWAGVVGGEVGTEEGYAWIEGATGFPWAYWVFAPVPEPKGVKNRLHWDVTLSAADPSPLIDAGALLLRNPDDDIWWWILADPEGNEFCAFPPEQPQP